MRYNLQHIKENPRVDYRYNIVFKLGVADCLYANEDFLHFVIPFFHTKPHINFLAFPTIFRKAKRKKKKSVRNQ